MEKEQAALEALNKYPEKVRLIYHPYPGSDLAYLLAQTLEFAAEEDRFWELHDRIVADVPEDEIELRNLLDQMDFDVESFDESMGDSRYLNVVEQGKNEAQALGISSFGHYINGSRYSGDSDNFLKVIEAEIESIEGSVVN